MGTQSIRDGGQTVTPAGAPPVGLGDSLYRRDGLLCALLMAACLLLAQPFVEMGFSDDWSYVKTTQVFVQTGHFAYNGWSTTGLGWQILWGALFSKLFGFSFVHVRLATLPIAIASVYLFHQIVVRFGISRRNAIFGTLTLALSPVFLAMSASYMSDIYALFCTFLCLYLCQRALSATNTDRVALAWLTLATVTNIPGGTVRQTAWLGVLVIVPSTVWLLRRRPRVFWGGALLWLVGVASVAGGMHWMNQQPYFIPGNLVPGALSPAALKYTLVKEILQGVKVVLCLLLMLFPVLAAWVPLARSVPPRLLLPVLAASSILLTGFLAYCDRHDRLHAWVAPWLTHVMSSMASNGGEIPGPVPGSLHNWQRIIVTALVLGSALTFFLHLFSRLRKSARAIRDDAAWSQMIWLLVPLSLAYIAALIDVGFKGFPMYDRYLLTFQAAGIIFLLRYYQDFAVADGTHRHPANKAGRFPVVSQLALAVCAYFGIAGTHDWFAISRARLEATEEIRRSGVPRTAIQAGFEYDSWTQLEAGGYINNPSILTPRDAYRPPPASADFAPECAASWLPARFTPAVIPQYFVVHAALPCLAPSPFRPIAVYSPRLCVST